MSTRAEKMMTKALEDEDINVLKVSERDGREMKVIHQLSEDDSSEDAALKFAKVGVAFFTLYTNMRAESLTAAVLEAGGDRAATYHCKKEWAEAAADAAADPTVINAERTRIAKRVADTLDDLRPIDDVETLLEEM